MTAYGSRSTRRRRRTAEEILDIKFAIHRALSEEHPMTVRQVFYHLVSDGTIEKTEAAYKSTVIRLLTQMRLDHDPDPYSLNIAPTIPFGWIADNTRWMRKPTTYSSVEHALSNVARTYRRSLWESADAYVEVWLEKDALAGVLYQETATFDVPLMVTRGYPSLSFVAEAAEIIGEIDKPAYLYYFGDHDPSGGRHPSSCRGTAGGSCSVGRHPLRAGSGHSRADNRMGSPHPADEAHRHALQDVRGRVCGGRCNPTLDAARPCG